VSESESRPLTDKSGREVELKLRVDDLAALIKIAIASGGTPQPTARQTNAFFDTPDRALGMRGLVVRLREETTSGRTVWFVTAKGPGHRSGSLTDVVEEEIEIDPAKAKAMLAGALDPITVLEGGTAARQTLVQALRNALAGRPAVLLGRFQNERTRVPAELEADGVRFQAVLELDRTSFPNEQVHHEVEMEVPGHVKPETASRAFEALFARAGVVGRLSPGKARRFFAALRGERFE
jgi:uncharacterized protein YjbK